MAAYRAQDIGNISRLATKLNDVKTALVCLRALVN
jgi:hypothetical protein